MGISERSLESAIAEAPGTGAQTESGSIEVVPGQILADRYEIQEKIGQGCTSNVFKAYDRNRRENIAVKVLFPNLLVNRNAGDEFLYEARLPVNYYHPNIVNLFDASESAGSQIITMELLKGQTLRQLMDDRKKARKPFSRKEVVRIAETLVRALAYVHIRAPHRDLRPENIWVDVKGNYRIMGFGVQSLMHATRGVVPGAVDYWAPEQLRGSNKVDVRADQYALGLILYELLTGRIPARGKKTLRVRHRKIGKDFAAIIERMLKSDPADRYQSIDSIGAELRELEFDRPSPVFNLKNLGAAVLFIVAIAAIYHAASTVHFGELWEDLRPLSANDEQQRFEAAIQRVTEAKNRIQRLSLAQRRLQAIIRDTSIHIQELENSLRRTRDEGRIAELRSQIDLARSNLERNERLKKLTNRVIFESDPLSKARRQVEAALPLIEARRHAEARDLLESLFVDLDRNLQQFNAAQAYLRALDRLAESRELWRGHNEAQSLKPPADIEQRKQAFDNAKQLAQQGLLAEAAERVERLAKVYQNYYAADRQRVGERERHAIQREKTLALEREWKNYLKGHGLGIDAEQSRKLEQSKTDELALLERQDFDGALQVSKSVEKALAGFYATAKTTVAETNRKRAAEQARKRKAEYERALAEYRQEVNRSDSGQAVTRSAKAPEQIPKGRESGKQPELSKSEISAKLLRLYAPGMEIVEIPAGSFRMGDLGRGGNSDEKPMRRVTMQGFGLTKREVTFAQYDIYARHARILPPADEGWGRDNLPVINVSWYHANNYARWLSRMTGLRFRLPSEAEWEYAARGGTETNYSWGNEASHDYANFGKDICCGGVKSGKDNWTETSPVGSFPENPFGIQDMHGNVWEWVQDCWNDSYKAAPLDGSSWLQGDCSRRVIRGGAWSSVADHLRAANREGDRASKRSQSIGFRLLYEH